MKGLHVRQGMFRLWIIASVLFVVGVGVTSYRGIREEFHIAHTDWDAMAKDYGGSLLVPADCSNTRGTANIDYSQSEGLCWYETETFRRLYPEYKDLSKIVLVEKLYAKAGRSLEHQHPWNKVAETAAFALGFPFTALALGWSLFWAFAGFRNYPSHKSELDTDV